MQALEGKDVKDMLVNVGSGGGAAAAPAAGGAATGGAAAADEPAKEEEKKEEGTSDDGISRVLTNISLHRKRRIGRRYGFRSLRLDCLCFAISYSLYRYHTKKASSCTALARLQMELEGKIELWRVI